MRWRNIIDSKTTLSTLWKSHVVGDVDKGTRKKIKFAMRSIGKD